jgi:U3 small nucleolar RNA-associated protein 11
LLEKHQDYVKRARDYHSKQDRLKILKSKAVARNKDEFYFGMVRLVLRFLSLAQAAL